MAVYVTHGTKYHLDQACPRMTAGEDLWDGDSEDWWHISGSYRREVATVQEAAARGKLPCLHCVPAAECVFQPLYGQTFGHKGAVLDGDVFCVRCRDRGIDDNGDPWTYPTLWPCTSAVVLGLVPRPA